VTATTPPIPLFAEEPTDLRSTHIHTARASSRAISSGLLPTDLLQTSPTTAISPPPSAVPTAPPSPPPLPAQTTCRSRKSKRIQRQAKRGQVKTGNGNSCSHLINFAVRIVSLTPRKHSMKDVILKARLLLWGIVCLRVSSSVLAFAPRNLQHFSFLYCIRLLRCNPLVRGHVSGRQQVHTSLRLKIIWHRRFHIGGGVFEGAGLLQVRKALLEAALGSLYFSERCSVNFSAVS
jgi:hypothetical protein